MMYAILIGRKFPEVCKTIFDWLAGIEVTESSRELKSKMAIMEGPLSKWTNVMKGWQYRWFVLDENAGLLSYYTVRRKMGQNFRLIR